MVTASCICECAESRQFNALPTSAALHSCKDHHLSLACNHPEVGQAHLLMALVGFVWACTRSILRQCVLQRFAQHDFWWLLVHCNVMAACGARLAVADMS